MKFYENLKSKSDYEAFMQFISMCKDPQSAQEEMLKRILYENRNCEFGKNHNFKDIGNVEDYRKSVPITHWDDYAAFSESMQNGKTDLMFKGKPEYFLLTSGTTGNEKLLPESRLGMQAKDAAKRLRRAKTAYEFPQIAFGKALPLVNTFSHGLTSSGIPYGSTSGRNVLNAPSDVKNNFAYPLDILRIQDQDSLAYTLMRFSVEYDVKVISAANAGRMEKLISVMQEKADCIIRDISKGTLSEDIDVSTEIRESISPQLKGNPKRADELSRLLSEKGPLLPSDYWPNLIVFKCWLSGSVGRYAKQIMPMMGKQVKFMDCGYEATEGIFNIPMEPYDSAGPLSLLGAFYEFASMDGDEKILLAHEIEDGKKYKLIITTFSGLYRYSLKDVIRVKGFTAKTPNVHFVSKTIDIGSICNERMYGTALIDSVDKVAIKFGLKIRHFCAITDMENSRYDFCIEVDPGSPIPDRKYLHSLENELNTWARLYKHYSEQGMLKRPRLVIMKKGWRDALYENMTKPGVSIVQIKLPIFYRELPLREYVLSVID